MRGSYRPAAVIKVSEAHGAANVVTGLKSAKKTLTCVNKQLNRNALKSSQWVYVEPR